jgi:hypothetical protein
MEITPSRSLPEDLRFDGTFISPIDGTVIRNKRELDDHNRRNGVVQAHDDRIKDVLSVQKENIDRIVGEKGREERREALIRAFETIRR